MLIGTIDIVLFIAAIVLNLFVINFLRRKEEIKKPLDAIPRNIYRLHGAIF